VTFLDAYALVAFAADEPAAEEVEAILREGEARVVVVNLAEAVDVSQRVHGLSAGEVRAALEPLLLGNVLSAAVSDELQAWLAAELRVKHFNKRTQALSMADCFLLAHAMTDGGPIATADPPIAVVARAEGVEVVALPDSSGERP
jgi:PIN domain nuclease of toxin-antitoxin system